MQMKIICTSFRSDNQVSAALTHGDREDRESPHDFAQVLLLPLDRPTVHRRCRGQKEAEKMADRGFIPRTQRYPTELVLVSNRPPLSAVRVPCPPPQRATKLPAGFQVAQVPGDTVVLVSDDDIQHP